MKEWKFEINEERKIKDKRKFEIHNKRKKKDERMKVWNK